MLRRFLGLLLLALAGPAAAQALQILSPREQSATTTRSFVNVLGRTTPGATVRVGGEAVEVFTSGVFARDRIPLADGANRIVVEAVLPGGDVQRQTVDVERVAPPAPPPAPPADRLFIEAAGAAPQQRLVVAAGETFDVAVQATPGQRVEALLPGERRWQRLEETVPGRYRAALRFAGDGDVAEAPVQLRVSATGRGLRGLRRLQSQGPAPVGQWRRDGARLMVAGADGADLLHGLHEVRLGGPNLAELPAGTLLLVTGQRGAHSRVQLAPDTTAWVASAQLLPAPAGSVRPQAFFTSVSVAAGEQGDVLTIPLQGAVPYAVRDVADAAGRIALEVELFGAHHATTWISHRAGTQLTREVTVQQAGPERVLVRWLPAAGARLWGWRAHRDPAALRIVLRAAPAVDAAAPLRGLHVALEAGHGSAVNPGAIGATGVPEKDFNRWTTEALRAELLAAGATVTMVRPGDENPPLRERARRAVDSPAVLFIAVHGNSADTGNGFLRVHGTSTYYKHATGRDLAAAIQRRLLEQTGLADFGVVGNFNYAPVRLATALPAVLVEQAFVSHPGDEARLLDPAFRATLARAVRTGIEDFLRQPAIGAAP